MSISEETTDMAANNGPQLSADTDGTLAALRQVSSLQRLSVDVPWLDKDGLLLHLTLLTQVTALTVKERLGGRPDIIFRSKVSRPQALSLSEASL
jgi:hypothetical protein